MKDGDEQEIVLQLTNDRGKELRFILEPWGEEFVFAPRTSIRLIARGPRDDGPEITYEEDAVTYWGWTGSVASIIQDETVQPAVKRPRVPPYP